MSSCIHVRRHTALPVALLMMSVSAALGQERGLDLETALDLRSVSDAQISPDGKQIAYLLSVPRTADEEPGRGHSELWVIAAEGGEGRRFTPQKQRASSPQWSPDGSRIAFLARRGDEDEHTQIYIIPVDGGEADLLTEHETSVGSLRWSPDGRSIAFIASAPMTDEEKQAEEDGRDWTVVGENQTYNRLWIADAETGDVRAVYDGDLHAGRFEWTPDCSTLVFTASKQTDIDSVMMFSRLYRVPAKGGQPRILCETEGKLGRFAVSPDGSTLAFMGAVHINDPLAQSVFVVPMNGGQPRNLTPDFEGSASRIAWADNATVIMLAREDTHTTLSAIDVSTGRKRMIDQGDPTVWSFSLHPPTGRLCAVGETVDHPSELFTGLLPDGVLKRITHHNPVLDSIRMAREETIEWKSADGKRIAGMLTYPLDYEPGQRYPLIANPHGGPEGTSLEGWNWIAQVFAARGYFVLLPNYRGSGGRGVAFSMGDQHDLGGLEFLDNLTGIDALIDRGLVDAHRVGMAGWSYGGYMSALAATHHSERFKVAVMGAGISNWISFMGATDIPRENALVHWARSAYDNYDLLWQRSPLSRIDKAQTPTLILHSAGDKRVPASQAWEMYRALKEKGVPTELVLYPRSGHGVGERAHRVDLFSRELEWFDRYLKPAANED